jgi:2-phospho-L-lactate guanylyltransferase
VHGKQRLGVLPGGVRAAIALAMLEDVLAACVRVGETAVVTADPHGAALAARCGATAVDDPGGGQGPAVDAALARVHGPVLVVNSDLASVVAADVATLWRRTPEHGLALAAALDGTTNALGLSSPALFAPLYGPGSAARFRAHAAALGGDVVDLALPGLMHDVDSIVDLRRLQPASGARTRSLPVPQPA